MITLQDHNDMKSIWETSDKKDLSENVANKTAKYVKK